MIKLSTYQRATQKLKGRILNFDESNNMIKQCLSKSKPVMISRFGTPESKCLLNFIEINESEAKSYFYRINAKFKNSISFWRQETINDLSDLVGFFPTDDKHLKKFSLFYSEKIKNIDAIGIWGYVPGESFLIKKYCPKALRYDPIALEPYFFDKPWSADLKGKKVLVIHPFTESIQKQYEKRTLLFENKKVLPEFELKTIKAVQSIAGAKTAFQNWFEALEWMQNEIDKCDFDIALIGAGAYGIPLSAYVKHKGKMAIHIGGSLQVLFGIKGNRWDAHPIISKFYNEHWIRPSTKETVFDSEKVEGSCYW